MNLLRACHRAMVLIALIEVFLVLVPDFVLSASSRLKKTAKKGKKDDQVGGVYKFSRVFINFRLVMNAGDIDSCNAIG